MVVAPSRGAGDKRLAAHKGQRHLRRIEIVAFGNVHISGHRFLRLLAAVAGKSG